jgi:hypothetical protein
VQDEWTLLNIIWIFSGVVRCSCTRCKFPQCLPLTQIMNFKKITQWPRDLRRGSAEFSCWNCGFESCRGHGCLSLVNVVYCQVEVSASGWSLVQRSPTESGVSECDREVSIIRGPWPTRGCCAMKKFNICRLLKVNFFHLKYSWCRHILHPFILLPGTAA